MVSLEEAPEAAAEALPETAASERAPRAPPVSLDLREAPFHFDPVDASPVSLRVRHGEDFVEVPLTFHEVRPEARGFWTDVAANGLALFFASALFLILKEALGGARQRQLRAAQSLRLQQQAVLLERLNAQLRESDGRLAALEASAKTSAAGGASKSFGDGAAAIREELWGLGQVRAELLALDAPAALALADELIDRARSLLRRRTDGAFVLSEASDSARLEGPHGREEEEQQADGVAKRLEAEPLKARSESAQDSLDAAFGASASFETQAASVRPDFELVQKIMKENPGMPPEKVIAQALALQKQRQGGGGE